MQLDAKISKERAAAKKLMTIARDEQVASLKERKKKAALVVLKKIKLQESLWQKADDQMSNLEQMVCRRG